MFTACVIKNLFTTSSVDLYSSGYEVNYLEWKYITSGEDTRKGQSAGRWHNYKPVEYMAIDIKGAIINDDVTSFWSSAATLSAVIPDSDSTTRDHVSITLTLDDGSGTQIYANCVVDMISMPRQALYPAVASFEFGFDCRDGYWKKVSDDSIYKIL